MTPFLVPLCVAVLVVVVSTVVLTRRDRLRMEAYADSLLMEAAVTRNARDARCGTHAYRNAVRRERE